MDGYEPLSCLVGSGSHLRLFFSGLHATRSFMGSGSHSHRYLLEIASTVRESACEKYVTLKRITVG